MKNIIIRTEILCETVPVRSQLDCTIVLSVFNRILKISQPGQAIAIQNYCDNENCKY